jgi:ATP-dependent exoDNAse (exonuclease V) beta subunit
MFNFTEDQRFAAYTLNRPLIVTAAAGSGKTTVLVARYLELLKSGLSPNQILTVTFTTDAAHQLRERIVRILKEESQLSHLQTEVERSRYIGTIHSFCYSLLQEFGSVLDFPSIEEIVSDYQFEVRLEQTYRHWLNDLSPQALSQLLRRVPRHDLRNLFSSLFEARHDLVHWESQLKGQPELSQFFLSAKPYLFEMEQSLHSQGLFRFNDLEQLSLELLQNHSRVRLKLQSQFQAVLIDEFQDTSQGQWNLFQQLIGEDFNKLFLVGDPKQSIYSFRHADVSLFFEVSQLTESKGGAIAELNTNFRTQAQLIEDINRFSQVFFEDSPIPFHPMESGLQVRGDSLKIHRYNSENSKKEAELEAVIHEIREHRARGHSLRDITLLFRMGDRIETYAAALGQQGIPAECTQTLSLFAHHDLLDLHHYLQALQNPKNEFSLSAFLFSPWVGLSISELAALRDDRTEIPFEEKAKKALSPNLDWFFSLAEGFHGSVREALYSLFENTSYFPEQASAFLEWLKPLTEKPYSLHEALQHLRLWQKQGILFKSKTGDTTNPAVKLMTVHASKGLEFEHVFLVDNLRKSPTQLPWLLTHPKEIPAMKVREGSETVLPPEYQKLKLLKDKLDSEESRRILYVAMTRAKNTLTLFLPSEMKGVPQGCWASLLDQAIQK